MKICIDGLSISNLKGTGYYSYLYGLCDCLLNIFPQPEYSMIMNNDSTIAGWSKYTNLRYSQIDVNKRDNKYKLIEDELVTNHINLYFSPNNGFSLPVNKVCKYMMAVHDLAPLSIRNLADEKYSDKFNAVFPTALKKADSIIAVSETVKREIIEYYGINDKKINVIYPCCLNIFKPIDIAIVKSVLKDKYGIEDKFILYAGSIHQRKNLDVLIDAFHLMSNEYKDIKLICVGNYEDKRKRYYLYLNNLIQEYNLQDKVMFLGTVDIFDMPYLYNGASCTVNISSYEGFPITALEASSCGSSYICLHNSSFDEADIPTAIYLEKLDATLLKNTLVTVIDKNIRNSNNINIKEIINSKYCWDNEVRKLIRIIEANIYD